MVSYDEVLKAVNVSREYFNLKRENYWVYFAKDGSKFTPFNDEHKEEGFIGYFVEDDSRLRSIYNIAQKRIRRA